jgi:hypothetical protein
MLKCFAPLRILTTPLFEETLGAFLFHPLFSILICFVFFSFFLCFVSWGFMIFEVKNHLFNNFFSNEMVWYGHSCRYTSSGRIFPDGVMHANIAKA